MPIIFILYLPIVWPDTSQASPAVSPTGTVPVFFQALRDGLKLYETQHLNSKVLFEYKTGQLLRSDITPLEIGNLRKDLRSESGRWMSFTYVDKTGTKNGYLPVNDRDFQEVLPDAQPILLKRMGGSEPLRIKANKTQEDIELPFDTSAHLIESRALETGKLAYRAWVGVGPRSGEIWLSADEWNRSEMHTPFLDAIAASSDSGFSWLATGAIDCNGRSVCGRGGFDVLDKQATVRSVVAILVRGMRKDFVFGYSYQNFPSSSTANLPNSHDIKLGIKMIAPVLADFDATMTFRMFLPVKQSSDDVKTPEEFMLEQAFLYKKAVGLLGSEFDLGLNLEFTALKASTVNYGFNALAGLKFVAGYAANKGYCRGEIGQVSNSEGIYLDNFVTGASVGRRFFADNGSESSLSLDYNRLVFHSHTADIYSTQTRFTISYHNFY